MLVPVINTGARKVADAVSVLKYAVIVEKSTKPDGTAPELSFEFSAFVIVEKSTKPEGIAPELNFEFSAVVMVENPTFPEAMAFITCPELRTATEDEFIPRGLEDNPVPKNATVAEIDEPAVPGAVFWMVPSPNMMPPWNFGSPVMTGRPRWSSRTSFPRLL